jgi:hypothetical protein
MKNYLLSSVKHFDYAPVLFVPSINQTYERKADLITTNVMDVFGVQNLLRRICADKTDDALNEF